MVHSSWHNEIYGELFSDDDCAKLFSTEKQFAQLLKVEAAWTMALGSDNTGNPTQAKKVADKIGAITIESALLRQGVFQDGIAIPALVRLMKQHLSEAEQRYCHHGLTSQDVIDTALILTLQEFRVLLDQRLGDLQKAFTLLQQKFSQNSIMAYTRMQAALPTHAGHLITQWQRPITHLRNEIRAAKDYLDFIQYGGAIGDRGSSRDGDHNDNAESTNRKESKDNIANHFAEQLGLKDEGFAWHTDRTRIITFAQSLYQLCQATGKIGTDIAFMAALGDEQLLLTKGGSSSAMAHKNNPIHAEALGTLASMAAMQLNGIQSAAIHENFRSGSAWSLEFLVLPALCNTTATALRIATSLLNTIKGLGVDN